MQCNIEISIDIIKDISNACMEMVKWRLECATTKPYFWASSGFHYATPLTRSWIDETVTNHIQVQVLFYCNHLKSQFKQHTRSKSHGMETMGGPLGIEIPLTRAT